jgi:hypothetical protein
MITARSTTFRARRAQASSSLPPARRLLLAVLSAAATLALAGATPALAEAPRWQAGVEATPTHLPPGGEGAIVVSLSNLGDAPVNGAERPVTITDKLPEGLKATALTGQNLREGGRGAEVKCPTGVPAPPLSCTFVKGTVYPYERLIITIKFKVEEPPGTVTSLPNEVAVEGGGALGVSSSQRLKVSGETTPFGIQSYELTPSNEDGTPATQAGSHPFQLTTTLVLNQAPGRLPVTLPKDLSFNLPPGLIGNPNAAAQCSEVDFAALVEETNLCPPSSVVGVATVTAFEPAAHVVIETVPVFNLVPAQGEPARFGLEVIGKIPIVIDTSVRSGRDYGVVASVKNATQVAGLLSSQVTFWGVPGDPRHNNSRGWECVAGGTYQKQVKKPCLTSSEPVGQPFLTLPTSCPANPAAEPLTSSIEADSWAQPGSFLSAEYAWMSATDQGLGTDGCNQLPFTPTIKVTPEVHSASTPTGLSVDVQVPQKTTLEASGLAEADVRDTTVTLPAGVQLSPAAANGLQACSEAQIGFTAFNATTQTNEFTPSAPSCPDASKVGVVHIKTPLLTHELEGAVYLAEQNNNPFGSLVALYVVAEDPVSGVLVKLAGEGALDENTLRVSTSFKNTPQVPFEDLKIDLFGGPRASVSTPPLCGNYATDAAFTPWSGTGTLDLLSPPEEFNITSGAGGGGCVGSPQPFSPAFNAQSTNTKAGAFSAFSLEITRPDSDQAVAGLAMHLPPGVAGILASVTRCPEPQASQGTCGPESEVGHAIESAGFGPEPFVVGGGRVYITGPYHGAPFGLSIVTPAVAGPFNLGTVIVRSRIFIDRETAALTIVSDPLPTQLKGIPLQLQHIDVAVDRPGFQFNPTNCSPMKVEGTLSGDQGGSANVSSPFQVGGCGSLPFSPTLTVATQGQTSKLNGASLTVRVTSTPGQANIAKTVLSLPSQLPSRLSTLQKACLAVVFESNPASCPEGSLIGAATVHTPVLSSPLTGPAYLVSHGSAAFPDVEFVLQGEGITLILDGQTDIKGGITTSSFNAVPDAPVSSFETTLPEGPHSALGATSNLCGQTLTAPTTITGQNAAIITQKTHVTITGCKAVKSYKATRAQLLAKALAACRKKYKHHHNKRIKCERQAHKRYPAKKTAHKTSKQHDHKGRP